MTSVCFPFFMIKSPRACTTPAQFLIELVSPQFIQLETSSLAAGVWAAIGLTINFLKIANWKKKLMAKRKRAPWLMSQRRWKLQPRRRWQGLRRRRRRWRRPEGRRRWLVCEAKGQKTRRKKAGDWTKSRKPIPMRKHPPRSRASDPTSKSDIDNDFMTL